VSGRPPREQTMNERTRILLVSIAILVIVSVSVGTLAIGVLYRATFEQHRDRLTRMVMHRARILETVAGFDAELPERGTRGVAGPTEVSQLVEVYRHFAAFGNTGEFTLARRAGDQIMWLLRSGQADAGQLSPTIFDSGLSQPMQRALSGGSGTMVGLDHRGIRVLAAYEPVPKLGWGVVAKIDLAEIKEPFVRVGELAGGIALLLIAAGVALNFRLASPLVQRIEARVEQRTAELSQANQSLKTEIRERQQTELALRRMSKVFMEATAPISIQDLSGRIVDVNAEAERTYGWSREELLGRPIDIVVPPEHLQKQHELAARCMRGEKVRNVEGWRQAKSGEVVPVLLTLSLLTDEKGASAGIATIAKDLTEQKRLEEQLRAAVQEATMADERARRELAVGLHDGVGQLLGLTSMKLGGLRTSVEAFGLDPEVRELEQILIEVQRRTSSLVFQLSPPTLHDVGLVAAAQSLADDMQRRFGLHVTLEEVGERQPLDETSRITLFRALRELLVNTAKHGKTEDADVRFSWRDRHIEITVEDNGVGFDACAPTSGYGLFSIRERLTHLGGSARIESSRGKGTRIVLTAPIATAEEETDTGLS
jgi:PAS domain S-box-containing protein